MKQILLFSLSFVFLFTSCQRESQCLPPPCPQPDLNNILSIELEFCIDEQVEDCFTNEDISQVAVVNKLIDNDMVISVDTLINLANFNNIVTLGQGFIPLTSSNADLGTLDLNFEIVTLNTGLRYTLTDIEVVDTNNDPCDCHQYQITSLKLNDELIEVNSSMAYLSLKK